MNFKKKILIFLSIPIIIFIGYLLNVFFGNPITKSTAKKEVLTYYEDKYNKEFEVYSMKYNFLIPDYNIKMGPKGDKEAVFETSRYELTMYDSYGAYLAGEKLESRILEIIANDYPGVNFTLHVQEEHHIEIAGVEFDFYTPEPQGRLEKNYFIAELSWDDNGLGDEETLLLMDEIAKKINTGLNGTPNQLSLDILVKEKNSENIKNQRFYINGLIRAKG